MKQVAEIWFLQRTKMERLVRTYGSAEIVKKVGRHTELRAMNARTASYLATRALRKSALKIVRFGTGKAVSIRPHVSNSEEKNRGKQRKKG